MDEKVIDSVFKKQFWNAFSNGVVPKNIDKSWLVGRDNELEALNSLVKKVKINGISSFKLIEGDYGSGKSLLLSIFEKECISNYFVVARLSLGSHDNFSKPEIIYRDIMNNLKLKTVDMTTEFEKIFELWLSAIKKQEGDSSASKIVFNVIKELQNYHPTFANVLLAYIRGKINNDVEMINISLAWIKGDYNISLEQKRKLGIRGNIDRYSAFDILRGFSKLVTLLGFNGLVILVDEMEYILRERIDIRDKAYTTMRHLIDEIGENAWTNTVFVGAHTPEMMTNSEKGYKSYEALYQRIASGFEDNGYVKNLENITIIPLKSLSKEEIIRIGEHVAMLRDHSVDPKHIANLSYMEFIRKQSLVTKEAELFNHQRQLEDPKKELSIREYVKIVIHMSEMAKANGDLAIFNIKGNI